MELTGENAPKVLEALTEVLPASAAVEAMLKHIDIVRKNGYAEGFPPDVELNAEQVEQFKKALERKGISPDILDDILYKKDGDRTSPFSVFDAGVFTTAVTSEERRVLGHLENFADQDLVEKIMTADRNVRLDELSEGRYNAVRMRHGDKYPVGVENMVQNFRLCGKPGSGLPIEPLDANCEARRDGMDPNVIILKNPNAGALRHLAWDTVFESMSLAKVRDRDVTQGALSL